LASGVEKIDCSKTKFKNDEFYNCGFLSKKTNGFYFRDFDQTCCCNGSCPFPYNSTGILLFYFILFYFILFYFILFYFVLLILLYFYFILFCFVLFYFILFYLILFYSFYFYFFALDGFLAKDRVMCLDQSVSQTDPGTIQPDDVVCPAYRTALKSIGFILFYLFCIIYPF
jgi:hypothetical protein